MTLYDVLDVCQSYYAFYAQNGVFYGSKTHKHICMLIRKVESFYIPFLIFDNSHEVCKAEVT